LTGLLQDGSPIETSLNTVFGGFSSSNPDGAAAGARVTVTLVNSDLVQDFIGDVNLDGAVNFSDIPAFIGVLASGEFQAQADVNFDGAVTFADIPPFIKILQGQ